MKTAISIPDPLFQAAESFAKRLKKSRSELYADAVAEYLQRHKNQGVTRTLNDIYGDEPSELEHDLQSMQSQSLSRDEW